MRFDTFRIVVWSALFSALVLLPGIARADQPSVGIFSNVRVEKGKVHSDDVVCIGGKATIEGTVQGEIVVILGELEMTGEAREDVVTVLSKTRLGPGVKIGGELVQVLGEVDRDPSVQVSGQEVNVGANLPAPLRRVLAGGIVGLYVLIKLFELLLCAVVLFLAVFVAPERVGRMAEVLEDRWPASLGYGVLGLLGLIVAIVILAITFIGIPVAILLGLAAWVLGLMGIAAALSILGRKIATGAGLTTEPPTLLGATVIGFLVVAVIRFIPVLGDIVWCILTLMGWGVVLITRLGSPAVGSAPGAPPRPAPAGTAT
jgi:hypothetical protein